MPSRVAVMCLVERLVAPRYSVPTWSEQRRVAYYRIADGGSSTPSR